MAPSPMPAEQPHLVHFPARAHEHVDGAGDYRVVIEVAEDEQGTTPAGILTGSGKKSGERNLAMAKTHCGKCRDNEGQDKNENNPPDQKPGCVFKIRFGLEAAAGDFGFGWQWSDSAPALVQL